jgi:hypothetical protein
MHTMFKDISAYLDTPSYHFSAEVSRKRIAEANYDIFRRLSVLDCIVQRLYDRLDAEKTRSPEAGRGDVTPADIYPCELKPLPRWALEMQKSAGESRYFAL